MTKEWMFEVGAFVRQVKPIRCHQTEFNFWAAELFRVFNASFLREDNAD
jgi:hypothetical protein